MSNDPINPTHYKHLPAEAIDIIMAAIAKAPSNEAAYLHGQALKYLLRCWSKKGIEDLRKAKWYLDRLVDSFDSVLAEINAPIEGTPIDEPIKATRKQPPKGYRLLGPANDEPRRAGDLYWSLSAKVWIPILPYLVECANCDNWTACRKIETPDDKPKRYRDPTPEDLKSGPIGCEYRDDDDEQWRSGLLVYVLDGDQPFLCLNKERNIANQWEQCRIEVTE
jgi:hypothetical protein